MYANLLEPIMVPVVSNFTTITNGKATTGVLDVVLTRSEDCSNYTYAIVNKDPLNDVAVSLDFAGKKTPKNVKATILSGNSADDYNDLGRENNVTPRDASLKVTDGKVSVPAHSLTILRF